MISWYRSIIIRGRTKLTQAQISIQKSKTPVDLEDYVVKHVIIPDREYGEGDGFTKDEQELIDKALNRIIQSRIHFLTQTVDDCNAQIKSISSNL